MEWIKVSDMLPENTGTYMVVWQNAEQKNIFTSSVDVLGRWTITRGDFYGDNYLGSICLGNVTHWAPLPEPPKD